MPAWNGHRATSGSTPSKEGYVHIINTDGTIVQPPFLTIPPQANNSWNNEQGLVGLAFHPQYQQNGLFYVFYNQKNTGVCTISRFMRSAANPDQADPISEGILLTYEHPLPNHVGGCMKFGPDGYLYIGTGDGGGGGDPEASGQNMLSFKGKILRINVGSQGDAYTIPAANPYLNAQDSIAPEIWASGLRNPWRFNFDTWTGDLWIADVGQDEREEINFQPANSPGGVNYGWSCMEGTMPFNNIQCFALNTLTGPLCEYNHDGQECSITGGTVYRGTNYADLFGKYLFTDFCAGKIWALANDGVPTVVQLGNFQRQRFTALEADNSGELYTVGFNTNKVYKITSNNCAPVAWLVAEPTATLPLGGTLQLNAYGNDLTYQWLLNGQPIAGANSNFWTVNAAGTYSVKVTNPANGCSNTSNETVVTAPVALSATIETFNVSCFGEADGTATVVAMGGSQN
ncbi:MAG: PQQ-dependent sugar dehydrogenase [Saprospiraceae bacterium]|nr:PQQ-dependent sugar dehydrogenase [Saprospiraceae bacterium]